MVGGAAKAKKQLKLFENAIKKAFSGKAMVGGVFGHQEINQRGNLGGRTTGYRGGPYTLGERRITGGGAYGGSMAKSKNPWMRHFAPYMKAAKASYKGGGMTRKGSGNPWLKHLKPYISAAKKTYKGSGAYGGGAYGGGAAGKKKKKRTNKKKH